MKQIAKITLKRVVDSDPDLSWLRTEIRDGKIINSCRYSDADIKKYGLEQISKWIEADHQRLAEYGEAWHMIGIFAEARIQTSEDGKFWLSNTVRSNGLWGIESDSDETYLQEVEAEEVESIRNALMELGFSADKIDAALEQKVPVKDRTRVIITINGGAVQAVHSTDPNLNVDVLDWDNATDEEASIEADVLAQDILEMHEISW